MVEVVARASDRDFNFITNPNSSFPGAMVAIDGTIWAIRSDQSTAVATDYSGVHQSSMDIALPGSGYNGATTDGTTLWFARNAFVRAYNVSNRQANSARNFDPTSSQEIVSGLACDGTTIWVLIGHVGSNDYDLRAYDVATLSRDSDKVIDDVETLISSNESLNGCFTDGEHIWVVNATDRTAHAIRLSDGTLQTDLDISISSQVRATAIHGLRVWLSSGASAQAFVLLDHPTVTLGEATESSLIISWTDQAADSYDVQYREEGAPTWISADGVTSTSYSITGLSSNTTYEVRVRSTVGDTDSEYSDAQTFTTLENEPPTVTVQADATTVDGGASVALDATITDPEGDTISTITWTADGGSFNNDAIEDPTWTAPVAGVLRTMYRLECEATDEHGNEGTGHITITVRAAGAVEIVGQIQEVAVYAEEKPTHVLADHYFRARL